MMTLAEAYENNRLTDQAREMALSSPVCDTHVYDSYTMVGFSAGRAWAVGREDSDGAHFFRHHGRYESMDGAPFFDAHPFPAGGLPNTAQPEFWDNVSPSDGRCSHE